MSRIKTHEIANLFATYSSSAPCYLRAFWQFFHGLQIHWAPRTRKRLVLAGSLYSLRVLCSLYLLHQLVVSLVQHFPATPASRSLIARTVCEGTRCRGAMCSIFASGSANSPIGFGPGSSNPLRSETNLAVRWRNHVHMNRMNRYRSGAQNVNCRKKFHFYGPS